MFTKVPTHIFATNKSCEEFPDFSLSPFNQNSWWSWRALGNSANQCEGVEWGGEAMVKEKEGEGGKWERGEEGGERRRGKEENGNNDKEENMQRQYQCKEMIA